MLDFFAVVVWFVFVLVTAVVLDELSNWVAKKRRRETRELVDALKYDI